MKKKTRTNRRTKPSNGERRKPSSSSRGSAELAGKIREKFEESGARTATAVAIADEGTNGFEFSPRDLDDLEEIKEYEFVRVEVGSDEAGSDDDKTDQDEPEEEVVAEEKLKKLPRTGSSGEDLLRLYFRDIGKIPLLSDQEVVRLAKKLERARKRRDKAAARKAKEKLVASNLRLVVSIAKKFSNCGMPLLDLIQAGNMGLMKAVDGFDYTLGFKFSTYASKWIQAAITRTISNQVRTVRIPVNVIPALKKVDRSGRKLKRELGRRPTISELARDSGVEDEKIRSMAKIPQRSISLDFPVDGENGDCTLGEILGDSESPSTTETVDKHFFREQLETVMAETLDGREEEVLRLRYGLEDGNEHTQSEIAERLNLSRQRVSQIENKALLRLRHNAGGQSLRSFFN